MIRLTAPKGLGDAIMLRAIVLHLLKAKEEVTVFTKWPDVFNDLPVFIKPLSEWEQYPDVLHASTNGRQEIPEGSSDFIERCKNAGISEPVEFNLDWTVKNHQLVEQIRKEANGRKIFIYQPLKAVHNEKQKILSPNTSAYRKIIEEYSDCYRIKLGHPPFVDENNDLPCELDLFGKAFIKDSFDVGTIGDVFFGESCFVIQMGEALNKPCILMRSVRAIREDTWLNRYHDPNRVFTRKHLVTTVYDEPWTG